MSFRENLKDELKFQDIKIKELLEEISITQEKARNFLKENKIKEYNEEKKKLEELKNKFNSIPLLTNYMEIREKVLSLIEQIASIIGD